MTNSVTQLSDERLRELAKTYYTPLYVFEESVIRSRCAEIKSAITYPNTHVRYACKALTLQAILKIIKDEGLWIDASSINEVSRAQLAGFAPHEIFYTGEGASESVYADLVTAGVRINCTSIDQIETGCSILRNGKCKFGSQNDGVSGGRLHGKNARLVAMKVIEDSFQKVESCTLSLRRRNLDNGLFAQPQGARFGDADDRPTSFACAHPIAGLDNLIRVGRIPDS